MKVVIRLDTESQQPRLASELSHTCQSFANSCISHHLGFAGVDSVAPLSLGGNEEKMERCKVNIELLALWAPGPQQTLHTELFFPCLGGTVCLPYFSLWMSGTPGHGPGSMGTAKPMSQSEQSFKC